MLIPCSSPPTSEVESHSATGALIQNRTHHKREGRLLTVNAMISNIHIHQNTNQNKRSLILEIYKLPMPTPLLVP